MKPLLVTAKQAADLLGLPTHTVYVLAASGELGERRYIGSGKRNFRLDYSAVEAYIKRLPTEPLEETA